jgi:hypothetical protein
MENKQKIMDRAWDLAYEGQSKFGGKVSEYFAMSLKLAWAEAKGQQTHASRTWVQIIEEGFGYLSVRCNVWEKYGKNRIYVDRLGQKLGYFDFTFEGKFVKAVETNSTDKAMVSFKKIAKEMAA